LIIEKKYGITIEGESVTKYTSNLHLSMSTQRLYHVATFQFDGSNPDEYIGRDVYIEYDGNYLFSGIVYSVSKTGRGYSIECRSVSALLSEPYSTHDETEDEATTSHELCELYSHLTGVNIVNRCVDLDFGGSYYRSGTFVTALTNIANVTGADYYFEDGTGVIIEPAKAIDNDGIELEDDEYFDLITTSRSVYNKGVGYITIQNGGSIDSSILSENRIHVEVDECTGHTEVYTNPFAPVEYTNGISISESQSLKVRTETYSMLDNQTVTLDGAIHSVKAVTLNGETVTPSSYDFVQGHNVLIFPEGLRGTLDVVYTAMYYKARPRIEFTPIGRFMSFDIYYLDQVILFQGFLTSDCGNDNESGDSGQIGNDERMRCIVPSDLVYPAGFDVWTIGGDPEFKFYNKGNSITLSVSSAPTDYISVETAILEPVGDGRYRYDPQYVIKDDLAATSAGQVLNYTIETIGDIDYFYFNDYYPLVKVSYSTPAIRHHIQGANIPQGEISMAILNRDTGSICWEGDISGVDWDDINAIPCEYPAQVPVDLGKELGVPIADIKGHSLIVTDGAGNSASYTINDMGFIYVNVDHDDTYNINTKPIKDRTLIVVKSNVDGNMPL
jgi:hypothetical protein